MADIVLEEPQKLAVAKKDSLFDEGFLIIIIGLGNVFNFYFHVFMGRNLGAEEYSALNSLMSLLYIICIPIVTIQTTVTKFIAQFSATGESSKVRKLFLESLKRVGVVAFGLMSLIVIGSSLIGRFLNIHTSNAIIMAGVLLFVTYLMPIFWAVLQGREQFRYLGFSYFASFFGKCGLGILFALLGWGIGGVLLGVVLSSFLAFLVAFSPIRRILTSEAGFERVDMGEIYRFALPVVTALFFLSFFCNLDVALVRHFYGETETGLKLAGYYALASIVGKAFLFLPIGITLALFPKVARKKALGEDPLPILKRGLFIEIALSIIGIISCFVLARYVALVLGNDAPEFLPLIKVFGIAITPVAATTILVNYNLANERHSFIWLLLPLTILTFAGIWFVHDTPMSVLLLMAAGGFSLFISISIFTFLPVKVKNSVPRVSAIS